MLSKTAQCSNFSALNERLLRCNMKTIESSLIIPDPVFAHLPCNETQIHTFGKWLFNQYRLFTLNKFALIITKQENTALFEYAVAYGYAWQEIWSNFYVAHPQIARSIAHAEPSDEEQKAIDKVLQTKDVITTEQALKNENGNPLLIHAGVKDTISFIEWLNIRCNEVYHATKKLLSEESPLQNDMFEWHVSICETYYRAITHLNNSGFVH